MHLEHINLTVADIERSVDFYRRLLGFRVRWEGETIDGKPAAHIGDDRHYLALFEGGNGEPATLDYDRTGVNHFGFVVEDLAAAKRKLATLGVEPRMEADYEPGKRLYFLDPDGVEVELIDYPAPVAEEAS